MGTNLLEVICYDLNSISQQMYAFQLPFLASSQYKLQAKSGQWLELVSKIFNTYGGKMTGLTQGVLVNRQILK